MMRFYDGPTMTFFNRHICPVEEVLRDTASLRR